MRPESVRASRSNAILSIEWSSGEICEISFADLRAACPCADCRGTHAATKDAVESSGLELTLRSDQATELDEIKSVGNYAIQISWKDGHTHGIYSWEYLQELCGTIRSAGEGEAE
jgi:DUF971 family protein